MNEANAWLSVSGNDSSLIVSMPHTGIDIPARFTSGMISPWLARKDADWGVERLYDFAPELGATIVRTAISRTIIDLNRDPSGRSLYPGQNSTELCPTTTFDGEPLYREGGEPDAAEIVRRRDLYFAPYHNALGAQIERLVDRHKKIVLFEAHSIRSRIPRLFEGELPHFNIGTNSGMSCDRELSNAVAAVCSDSQFSHVVNGRFRGGYTTRHYGEPARGVHAIQLELAMRAYMDEPASPSPENWPSAYDPSRADPLRTVLRRILETCLEFASHP
ncbi:MAG TPA: N-formylglutamate deformylase [Rhizomicrobium sp.]|nr:N-formylglutamate deformylase [Rhizomicrobium sp.]